MPKWVVPVIVFDLVFLPFPHLGPVPAKLGYLLLGLFAFILLKRGQVHYYIPRTLLAGFGLLILTTMAGYLVFLLSGGTAFNLTVPKIVVYGLAPLAFIIGSADRRDSHNYVPVFLGLYLIATSLFTFLSVRFDWLARLYGVDERVALGLYVDRSQGLHFNANISALFASLLALFLYAGIKYGFVRVRPSLLLVAIVSGGATVLLLLSRNQLIAYSMLVMFMVYSATPQNRIRSMFALAGGVGALFLVAGPLGLILDSTFGYNPLRNIKQEASYLANPFDARADRLMTNEPSESSPTTRSFGEYVYLRGAFFRPIADLPRAAERWQISPIVGTGFDKAEEVNAALSDVRYHNDWLTVAVTSGLIGLAVLAIIVAFLTRIEIAFVLPFVLPGLTNAFIFAPSHLIMFMIIAGIVWRRKQIAAPSSEASIARRHLPAD